MKANVQIVRIQEEDTQKYTLLETGNEGSMKNKISLTIKTVSMI